MGYITVIAWVARDLWQRKQTLSSGCALGFSSFTAINPWHPCYNYYISSVLPPTYAYMFILEVKVQYTNIILLLLLDLSAALAPFVSVSRPTIVLTLSSL